MNNSQSLLFDLLQPTLFKICNSDKIFAWISASTSNFITCKEKQSLKQAWPEEN